MILRDTQGIAEALEVDDLAGSEEFDGFLYIGIVAKTENVIIGRSRLLFCYYHVFATKLSLAKVRKILILQGMSALFGCRFFRNSNISQSVHSVFLECAFRP